YDSTHLGHAATYLTYDVLQRRLRDLGHDTRCVRNVTDVDDSILPKARELGVHYLDLAAAELARFDADMERLERLPAWSQPRVARAAGPVRVPRHPGLHRHGPRLPLRLPGGRLGVLRGGELPEVRRHQPLLARSDARPRRGAGRQRRRPPQARSARLRAVAAV